MFRYLEIKQHLLNRLLELEPNTRLPSRNTLCQEYLVTRTTIDRAVDELLKEGYLYAVNGSGTFVADLSASVTPVRNSAMNVGVIVPNMSHDTYPVLLNAIERVMQHDGVNVVISNTDHDSCKQFFSIRRMLNSGVAGLILIPAVVGDRNTDLRMMQELSENDIPLVFCNRSIDGINAPLVCTNSFYGGYLAARHLLQNGYRKIAYLSPIRYKISTERYQGYLAALWNEGMDVDPELIVSEQEPGSVSLGYELMKELLRKRPDVEGVFAFNDEIGCGAINAIRDAGREVCGDIGVVGYDDSSLCEAHPEKLTSVAFMSDEIGARAAEILLSWIRTKERPREYLTVFRPKLHIRQSCLGRSLQR